MHLKEDWFTVLLLQLQLKITLYVPLLKSFIVNVLKYVTGFEKTRLPRTTINN